ncbi:unnamed protein product [Euphydryas editha]|uniref:monoamine oxidase n=1 Tax=Euphydryas editha TaxID=104508 RepID=A0AAU9USA8_EUPED|nr:unnamed protein product [Euphydryas editha]
MVKKYESSHENSSHIKADVIILGCSLPGIVTAHKLKKKFGNTMDIVVLDLAGKQSRESKCNVAFLEEDKEENREISYDGNGTAKEIIDNVARHYLAMFAKDFDIPLPDAIIAPEKVRTPLNKLFEYKNGTTVACVRDFHEFDYLNVLEKFELNQYHALLDEHMKALFQGNKVDEDSERNRLLYYDQTTMEKHICGALLFPNSRDIMRNAVRLVCGASAKIVSVLFYLHQCYRSSSSRNHFDGNNTKFREKLHGYCRKRLTYKLQKSVANITLTAKAIKKISSNTDEQVILKTIKGDTNYVCSLLAMALKPDELRNIEFETQLLTEREFSIITSMIKGKAKRFIVQYEEHFWRKEGYSGDILSIRGPIIWATERPKTSSTGSMEKYAALIGYLTVKNNEDDSKDAVLKQLVRLFGEEAATPINYKETDISDIYVPRCGDFIALRRLTLKPNPKYLEWGALDVFADGDVASALEAGHVAYLHLLRYLRPQAQTFDEICIAEWPTMLNDNPFREWLAQLSITSSIRLLAYTTVAYIGIRLIQSLMRK